MRKAFIGVCVFGLLTMTVSGQENAVTLDEAIKDSVSYLINRLDRGTKVTVLNINSDPAISNYIIEELTAFLVNNGNLVIVDRNELNLLQMEMDFQLSGEVSDESAQSIGKKLGAQTIISGSLSPLGNNWRMRVKALEVETARIQGVQTYTIKRDSVISSLLPKKSKVSKGPKTVGEKVGIGALNLVLGLGSYIEGDIIGGLTITSGYAVAAGLFVVEATVLDWDNPAVGVPATIGLVTASVTLVYGFIRPFIYNRNPKVAILLDNMHIDVVTTSVNDSVILQSHGIYLVYTFKF